MSFLDTSTSGEIFSKFAQTQVVNLYNPTPSNGNGSRVTSVLFAGNTASSVQGTLGLLQCAHNGTGADFASIVSLYANVGTSGTINPGTDPSVWTATTSAFTITPPTTINNNLSVTGSLTVSGTTTLYGATTIQNNLIVTGSLTVSGALSFSSISVSGNCTVGGNLGVSGTSTLVGAVTIDNNLSVTGTLTVTGTSTLVGSVTALTNLGVSGNLTITGTSTLFGLTTVNTFFQTPVNVVNVPPNPLVANTLYHAIMTLSATWNLPTVPPDGTIVAIVDANNNFATFNQTLHAGGPDVIRGSDATGTNNYSMNGNSEWYELMYQGNSGTWTLRVNNNWNVAILASNNIWTGTNQWNNTSTFNGTVQVNNNLAVTGTLTVTGTSTLNGVTTVNNNLNVTGTLIVTGTSTLNGAVTVNNNLGVTGTLTVTGSSTLVGAVTALNNLGISGNLTVTGTSTHFGLTTVNTFIQTPVNVPNVPPNPLVANTLYHAVMTGIATWNLPTAPPDGSMIQIVDANNNFATFNQTLHAGGSDVIRGSDSTGTNSYTMSANSAWYELMYESNSATWSLRANLNWSVAVLASNNIWTGTNQWNNTSTFNGTVQVNNNLAVTGTLTVTGTTTLNGATTINNNLNVTGTLIVTGTSTLNGAVTVNNNLGVTGTLIVTGTTTHFGAVTINNNLGVTGTLTVTGTSTLVGAATALNNLGVSGNLTVTGTSTHFGLTTVNTFIQTPVNVVNAVPSPLVANTLYHAIMTVTGTWTLPTVPPDGTLMQIADANNNFATFNQTLQAGGPDVIRGANSTGTNTYTMNANSGWYVMMYESNSNTWTLRASLNWSTAVLASNNIWTGTNQWNNTSTFNGSVQVNNNLAVTGTLTVTGTSTLNGVTTINNNLNVTGALVVTGTTTLNGVTTINNNLNVTGTLTVTGTSTLNGVTTINNNLNVTGALVVTGTTTLNGVTTINNNLNVTGTLTVTGAATFNGLTTHNGAVQINNNLAVTGTLTVTGTSTLNGVTTINNNLNVTGQLTVTGVATFNAGVLMNSTLALVSNLTMSGTAILQGTTNVTAVSTGSLQNSGGFYNTKDILNGGQLFMNVVTAPNSATGNSCVVNLNTANTNGPQLVAFGNGDSATTNKLTMIGPKYITFGSFAAQSYPTGSLFYLLNGQAVATGADRWSLLFPLGSGTTPYGYFTVPVAGIWRFTATIVMTLTTGQTFVSDQFLFSIWSNPTSYTLQGSPNVYSINGGNPLAFAGPLQNTANSSMGQTITYTGHFNAADTVLFSYFHFQTGNYSANINSSSFCIEQIY